MIAAFGAIVEGVREKVGSLIGFIASLPGRIVGALGNLGGLLYAAGRAVLQGFLDGLKSKWHEITGFLSGLAPQIPRLKGPASEDLKLLRENGRLIMQGLQNGIEEGWRPVESRLSEMGASLGALIDLPSASTSGRQRERLQLPSASATLTPLGVIPGTSGRIAPAAAGVGSSGSMAEIHTHVYLDSTQIAEVIRREYLRFEKRNGRAAV
jgi:phage-related protein